ncbi:MAG: metal-dependent phosphohydrolase [Acidobacteria bacterium RIFCSPLOWO2_02_FULL_60_20]|nr:MAG: metal-dependent phosphohydrolase [Acidobacteria bacterium RIFCSPLOWO2_02_FULL_60_20]
MLKPELRPATVLVADDLEAYRSLLSDLLEERGYKVICAADGDEAMKILEGQAVDLALLDVMMPRRTGFAVCRALKSDPASCLIPVVLVTGLDNTDDRIQGIECGADDFLSKPVNKEELLARVRSLLRLKQFTNELENAETVLSSLALSIEAKDPYTEGHCERLSKYSVALAARLELPEEQREALRRGGIVHDIGKVAVPEHILLKPGPLTSEERIIMQRHPVVGERICAPLKSFRLVLPIIRYHHEKYDGSGYPEGLKGEEIPLTARILQTVDVYDALTTDRPYRKALQPQQAFGQIREEVKRGWWDVALVDELQAMLWNGRVESHSLPSKALIN